MFGNVWERSSIRSSSWGSIVDSGDALRGRWEFIIQKIYINPAKVEVWRLAPCEICSCVCVFQ